MNHNANINPKIQHHQDQKPGEFNSKGWDSSAPNTRPGLSESEPNQLGSSSGPEGSVKVAHQQQPNAANQIKNKAEYQTTPSHPSRSIKAEPAKASLQIPISSSIRENNIFQQFIQKESPNILGSEEQPASGTSGVQNNPQSSLSNTKLNSSNKSQVFENQGHKNLSHAGKQSMMAGAGMLQISNQSSMNDPKNTGEGSATASTGPQASSQNAMLTNQNNQQYHKKNQSVSFEESTSAFYGHNHKDTFKGTNEDKGDARQMINTLNQNLMQIGPQTTKRGQKRHFPAKNDITSNMFFEKQQVESMRAEGTTIQAQNTTQPPIQGQSGQIGFRRPPFISGLMHGMSPVQPGDQKWSQNQQTLSNAPQLGQGDKNYNLKSEQKSGESFKKQAKSVFDEQRGAPRESSQPIGQSESLPKPYKQSSLNQKNRSKLGLGIKVQSYSLQKPDEGDNQAEKEQAKNEAYMKHSGFKSHFGPSVLLGQYGQTVLNSHKTNRSPKQAGPSSGLLVNEIVGQAIGQALKNYDANSIMQTQAQNQTGHETSVNSQLNNSNSNGEQQFGTALGQSFFTAQSKQNESNSSNTQDKVPASRQKNQSKLRIAQITNDRERRDNSNQKTEQMQIFGTSYQKDNSHNLSTLSHVSNQQIDNTGSQLSDQNRTDVGQPSREQKLQSSNKKRQLSKLNKTDEKQKGAKDVNTSGTAAGGARGDKKSFDRGLVLQTTQKNFRKYKKQQEPNDQQEINVLGQPLRTQYGNEDFQSIIDRNRAQRMGTGLFSNNIPTRGKFQTNRNTHGRQNSIDQPITTSEKTTAAAATTGAATSSGGPGTTSGGAGTSFNAMNVTNIGSFQNQDTSKGAGMNLSFISQPNQRAPIASGAQQPGQQNFKRKHKSIFSNSNFSGNQDNIVQDYNYTTKGSNENQRIAWEIKFNQSNKKEKDPTSNPNLAKSFKLSKLGEQPKGHNPNLTANTNSQGNYLNQSMNTNNGVNSSLHASSQHQPPLTATNSRSKAKNLKVKLFKISQPKMQNQAQLPIQNSNNQIRLQTLSPTKPRAGPGTTKGASTGLVNQMRDQVGRFSKGSGQQDLNLNGQSSTTKYEQSIPGVTSSGNSAVFRRQSNKGGQVPLRVQNMNSPTNKKQGVNFQKHFGKKQQELLQQTFKKGGRTFNKFKGVEESPVNQTKSSLPAELIVMGYKQKEPSTPSKGQQPGVQKYCNLKVTTSTIGDQNKVESIDPNESGDQSFQRDISFINDINEAIGEVDQTHMSREGGAVGQNQLKIFDYQERRGDDELEDNASEGGDDDFYPAMSPQDFDQYISDAPDKYSGLPLDSARTPHGANMDESELLMTPGGHSDVNPSANPSSSVTTSNKFSRKSKQSSSIQVGMPRQNIVPQQKQMKHNFEQNEKAKRIPTLQLQAEDFHNQSNNFQTSRPSNLANLESNNNESIAQKIKSCANLQQIDDIELAQMHFVRQQSIKVNDVAASSNSVDKVYYTQTKPAQSVNQVKQHTNMGKKHKKRQSKWSGGMTTKTQMKFYKLINQNKKIRDQLAILKKKGTSNESNSLFKQLVSDIKRVAKQSMTHSEIVNCIKASSIGSLSGFAQSHTPNNQGPQLNQNLVSAPPLLTAKSAKKNNLQAQQNSYGNESKDQGESGMFYNNNSDNNACYKKFKKSQSLISIKRLGPPTFVPQTVPVNHQKPKLLASYAQHDSYSYLLNDRLIGKLDSDPISSYSLNLANRFHPSSSSIKLVKQDNFVAKQGRNQYGSAANFRTLEPSQQKKLQQFKNMTYLNRQSGSNLQNPTKQILMKQKSKTYKSHKNLNTQQQLAKKRMAPNNQILPGVKSERYLVEKYDNALQPMVISRGGKVGLIGVNPAALNSVNPSSRGVPSRNQEGKPFGAFLQAQNQIVVPKQDQAAASKLTAKSRAELAEDQPQMHSEVSKSSFGKLQRDQFPGLHPLRYMHDDESVQHERAFRPGEPGNPGVPGSLVEQPVFNRNQKQTPASLIQMNKKNLEKKKQMAELNQKSQSLKNYSAGSQPSQFSFPSLPSHPNSGPKQQSVAALGGTEQKSVSKQTNSSGDKAGSNYVAKYQKSQQVQYLNQMAASQQQDSQGQNQYQIVGTNQLSQGNPLFGNQMHQQTEPVEYGQIIRWRQGEIIGLGSSSIVYSAIRVDNNTLLAVKKFKVVSDVSGIDQSKLKIIKNEIQKYKQFEAANIVKFYGCELLDQYFCIYLEQMETSLANVLSEYGYFDEATIRYYTKQILTGLAYLHDQKIKHLDLKCSNILTNNDGIVKLCDFGSSREFKKGSSNNSSSFTSLKSQIVGSVQWMAPEVIIEKGSGSKSDIWSLGCTIVEMFNGGNPWGDKIDDQNLYLAQHIITSSELLPQIPASINVSPECEDFLSKCLTREYDLRPTAHSLLQHPWILKEA